MKRKHWTRVAPLAPGLWLVTCDCGNFQLEATGRKGDAVEEAKRHQAVAEYREGIAA